MKARWTAVVLTAVLLVVAPVAVAARPVADVDLSAAELAGRIGASAGVGWSGRVESTGSLAVPDSESFASLATLLGERTTLRVWWRSPDDWRVDRVRSTGETNLFRRGDTMVRWVYESGTATYSPVSRIRLPDASDLLPPTLARSLLQGVRTGELTRLPARRVAGIAAAGLRLVPDETATTIGAVEVWADPGSGLPLRVDVFGAGEPRPVLSTSLREVTLASPAAEVTDFTPSAGMEVAYEESVDVAAAANAFAPYDLPATLAGLLSRRGEDPGAVGVYGRGPTTMIVLPLRGRVAGPLRERLRASAAARETEVGVVAPVGPVGMLLTPYASEGGAFLLAGTVTPGTLQRAAASLLAAS